MIRAAGGAGALSAGCCVMSNPVSGPTIITTTVKQSSTATVLVQWLCWHCDNQLRDQTSESLGQFAHQNLSAWMIDVIRHAMNGTQERELSLAELYCWAAVNDVVDAMTENMARRILKRPGEKIRSIYRESDIIPGEATATSILKQRNKNIALPPYAHQQHNPTTGKDGGQHRR